MLLYDRKDSSIDVYTMRPNNEKIREYKKNVLEEDNLFYSFKTNYYEIITIFKRKKEFKILNIDNYFKIEKMVDINDYDKDIQNKIIEDYIDGKYTFICPKKTFLINRDNYFDKKIYYFLESQRIRRKTLNKNRIYEIKNILNLPKKLYLLQLLEQGRFKELENEDIDDLLELFDISFSKNISTTDFNNINSITVDKKIKKKIK